MNLRLLFPAAAAAGLVSLGLAAQGASASPSPSAAPVAAGSHVHILKPPPANHPRSGDTGADTRQGSPPLTYHGGPIQKTQKVYTIFWNPGHLQSGTAVSWVAGYKTLINRWFHDANSSGVWANNKQYTGTNGAPTTTSFGSSWNDKNPFPVNTCTTSHTGGNCISDAAIQQEVANLAAAHSITPSLSKIFFVYTPKGEGSCQTSGTCPDANASYTGYCAYHGNFGTNVIYANMPYPTDVGGSNCYYPKSQKYQTYPNNNINADAVINVTSHEQNEAATDALVSTSPYAWYDAAGYENGDECAWNFAPPTGPNGADTVANGNPYELQQEGSNLASNCVISGPSGP